MLRNLGSFLLNDLLNVLKIENQANKKNITVDCGHIGWDIGFNPSIVVCAVYSRRCKKYSYYTSVASHRVAS